MPKDPPSIKTGMSGAGAVALVALAFGLLAACWMSYEAGFIDGYRARPLIDDALAKGARP